MYDVEGKLIYRTHKLGVKNLTIVPAKKNKNKIQAHFKLKYSNLKMKLKDEGVKLYENVIPTVS